MCVCGGIAEAKRASEVAFDTSSGSESGERRIPRNESALVRSPIGVAYADVTRTWVRCPPTFGDLEGPATLRKIKDVNLSSSLSDPAYAAVRHRIGSPRRRLEP